MLKRSYFLHLEWPEPCQFLDAVMCDRKTPVWFPLVKYEAITKMCLIYLNSAKRATLFESIGWKVFRVPETATVLMSGGIAFGELNQEQVMDFQVLLRDQ